MDEIQALTDGHVADPGARQLQKRLAQEVTTFVHGEEECKSAMLTTEKLFAGDAADNIRTMSESEILASMEGVPTSSMGMAELETGIDIVSFLASTGIFPSKGEARKTVQGGGVSVNREKISDISRKIDATDLLAGKYILVTKGKKHHHLVLVS
jgi:tyrosyl-tRNA synthetase